MVRLGVGENAESLISLTIDLDTVIEISQPSRISNVSISGADGGNVTIETKNIGIEDGSGIAVSPFGDGNAGDIVIDASESVELIGSSSRTGSVGSSIAANTFARGNAGNININTERYYRDRLISLMLTIC